ncbi:hypothetical protein P4O66_003192 [Electrophorus voltai]|uniref:Uncharacterized protein n=1 Tax=Electrophorus voltai TaxID=2609070 RepID=A0AAD8YR80_9TELE|nr:hypothetical protein P4O66_003192 [Electrophorus voltai]
MKDACEGEQETEGEERRQMPFHNPRSETLRYPGSPHTPTTGEEATGQFWGDPEYGPGSDSAESHRPPPDYEDQHAEVDSAGSYDPYMELYEGSVDYGDNRECSVISLRSNLGFNYWEDPSMDEEGVLYGDPPNISDVDSADYKSDKPLALKIPPKAPCRRCHSRASKPSRVAQREATAFEEETPSTRGIQPRNPCTRGGHYRQKAKVIRTRFEFQVAPRLVAMPVSRPYGPTGSATKCIACSSTLMIA